MGEPNYRSDPAVMCAFIKRNAVESITVVKDEDEREAAVKTASAFKGVAPKIRGCCGTPDECGGCEDLD